MPFESHDKTNKTACAPSQDSDQPGHSLCAHRVSKNPWYSCGQRRNLIRLGRYESLLRAIAILFALRSAVAHYKETNELNDREGPGNINYTNLKYRETFYILNWALTTGCMKVNHHFQSCRVCFSICGGFIIRIKTEAPREIFFFY